MHPKGLDWEARDGMVFRGNTSIDDELPRRKMVAVPNLTSCTEQEVGYLRRAPQYLDFGRAGPLLQGSAKEEQLQGLKTSINRDVSREARRDTRRRMETLKLLGRPDDGRGTRGGGRCAGRQRERSGGSGWMPLHDGRLAWAERETATRRQRCRRCQSRDGGQRRTEEVVT